MAAMSISPSQIWSRVSKRSQQQAVLARTTMLSQSILKAQDFLREFPSVTTQVKLIRESLLNDLKAVPAVGFLQDRHSTWVNLAARSQSRSVPLKTRSSHGKSGPSKHSRSWCFSMCVKPTHALMSLNGSGWANLCKKFGTHPSSLQPYGCCASSWSPRPDPS